MVLSGFDISETPFRKAKRLFKEMANPFRAKSRIPSPQPQYTLSLTTSAASTFGLGRINGLNLTHLNPMF